MLHPVTSTVVALEEAPTPEHEPPPFDYFAHDWRMRKKWESIQRENGDYRRPRPLRLTERV